MASSLGRSEIFTLESWNLHSVTLSLGEKGLQRPEPQLARDALNGCRLQAAGL